MYYYKCPKCGAELYDECTWDIVTDSYCVNEKCKWRYHYGRASMMDGETGLEYEEDYYAEYDMLDEIDEELENTTIEVEKKPALKTKEEKNDNSDDMPF